MRDDEDALTQAIIRLASEYGRYGYRRITALLRAEGWDVNHKRVWRIWRREGLKVPMKQPKKGRLWLYRQDFFRAYCRFLHTNVTISSQPEAVIDQFSDFGDTTGITTYHKGMKSLDPGNLLFALIDTA